jgi:hypothetical protein
MKCARVPNLHTRPCLMYLAKQSSIPFLIIPPQWSDPSWRNRHESHMKGSGNKATRAVLAPENVRFRHISFNSMCRSIGKFGLEAEVRCAIHQGLLCGTKQAYSPVPLVQSPRLIEATSILWLAC